jgi:AcrR family transcriptional regulator
VTEQPGLRERKKLWTAQHISETAVSLFLDHGFGNVPVADIAQAADVSKKTVFNYFPAKEDLVLFQIRDHMDEPARTVTQRHPGQSPVGALRERFLTGLLSRDPITGLNDNETILSFQRMVLGTPSLKLRLLEQQLNSEDALALALTEALGEPPGSIIPIAVACQIIAVQRTLIVRNLNRMLDGASADEVHTESMAEAETAFGLLEEYLDKHLLADGPPPAG